MVYLGVSEELGPLLAVLRSASLYIVVDLGPPEFCKLPLGVSMLGTATMAWGKDPVFGELDP